MAKNTGKNTDNLIPWKEGDPSPNPNGRPKGQRNYATIYKEALLKIAELNKITPDELENDIIAKAVTAARKGDYRFYKDVLDRIHGKPVEHVDHTSGGRPIPILGNGISTNNSNKEDSEPGEKN